MDYAYPNPALSDENYRATQADYGMSLRDWFAANASADDVKAHMEYEYDVSNSWPTFLGPKYTREQARYRYADAMLEARK